MWRISGIVSPDLILINKNGYAKKKEKKSALVSGGLKREKKIPKKSMVSRGNSLLSGRLP